MGPLCLHGLDRFRGNQRDVERQPAPVLGSSDTVADICAGNGCVCCCGYDVVACLVYAGQRWRLNICYSAGDRH